MSTRKYVPTSVDQWAMDNWLCAIPLYEIYEQAANFQLTVSDICRVSRVYTRLDAQMQAETKHIINK